MKDSASEQNFNREIEMILDRAEQRIGELKELRQRMLHPWEKKSLFEQLSRLEKDGSWSKRSIKRKLGELEKSIRRLYIDFAVTFSLMLTMTVIFAWILWVRVWVAK